MGRFMIDIVKTEEDISVSGEITSLQAHELLTTFLTGFTSLMEEMFLSITKDPEKAVEYSKSFFKDVGKSLLKIEKDEEYWTTIQKSLEAMLEREDEE